MMKRKVNKVNHTTHTRAYNVRAAATPLIVEGTAIVFDRPANLGGVTERIARSALDGVNLDDITLLVNHDGAGIPLARSPKTMTLTVTDSGLEMRAELPDTAQGRAVYEAVKRGDLSQMSFAFDIGRQTFDERARERTITQVARVYEISIVNRAAYPQTHVTARNAQEGRNDMFNPIESAVLNAANVNPDTHATPEYRAAFYKKLLGKELTETEQTGPTISL